jgi:hypothetical protein
VFCLLCDYFQSLKKCQYCCYVVVFTSESYCHYCSGVVSHYFLPRWRLFLNALNTSLVTGSPFNQTHTAEQIFTEVEKVFTLDTTLFPTIPQGNKIPHLLSLTLLLSLSDPPPPLFPHFFICRLCLRHCHSLFLHSSHVSVSTFFPFCVCTRSRHECYLQGWSDGCHVCCAIRRSVV